MLNLIILNINNLMFLNYNLIYKYQYIILNFKIIISELIMVNTDHLLKNQKKINSLTLKI